MNQNQKDRQGGSSGRTAPNVLAILAFVLAVAAFFYPRPSQIQPASHYVPPTATLEQIKSSKLLRIGFEGYPPYAEQNPNDQSMSGYSVDLATEIANQAGWRVEWIKTSPETKISDLKSQRFDLMVEPIFQTIDRAKEVAFTRPYAYFGYAAGIVRKGETRFQSFSELNKKGVVVAVRQGYTDETYAESKLPDAEVQPMAVDGIGLVFAEVTSGKADIALADASQVADYAREHPTTVDTRFLQPPPASVPAGFIARQQDLSLVAFLNAALDNVEANGFLDALDSRYHVIAVRDRKNLR